ncbi:efflux RND transporter periplasmic adaptor subunit [Anaeromyxobacter terrae]|uniref:efflux RND transporter periplasmic adaptor subunit n=1 Tax=Anaeromyxobacter terrae TaxID=2925406 RepID=UPI001F5AEE1F|nr:efflux RND transporter periplasmic adaptor subunit [Anaeromyxobacter sp. SG22]
MTRVALAAALAAVVAGAGCTRSAPSVEGHGATPEKSALGAGAEQVASAGAPKLCEHGVPAELCTRCNPDLIPAFKEMGDWCEEHGVPESQCKKCNPGLTFTTAAKPEAAPNAEPWCNEHAVPEAMCTKCRPQLIAKFIQAGDYCREHGYPESVCPYCHPEKVKAAGHELPSFPEPGTKIRLASAETEREAGIVTTRVAERPFAPTVEAVGQLEFDQNKLARLSARGEATVVEVKVDVGEDVRRGQRLVVLASGAVGGAQSRLAAAEARAQAAGAALTREESLVGDGISSRRDVEQARTELATAEAERDAARAELRAAGAGDAGGGGRYALVAPFDGTVVARAAVAGRAVSAEDSLVEIADVRTLWAVLDVPEEHAGALRAGQKVTVRVDGSGEVREARVTRVPASIDPRTRTVRVRVDLPNKDRVLRAGAFVRGTIEVASPRHALLVPLDAIQRAQEHDLVFVRTAPGQYDPVSVKLGARAGGEVEVVGGLAPGSEVVTTGAFVLKTEILKDSIGAGCADD